MKFLQVDPSGEAWVRDRPVPRIGQEEVLIRMKACGLCGTDLHKIKHGKRDKDYTPGHEVSGIVVSAGKQVRRFSEGDRIFVAHHVPCFSCRFCLKGHFTLCKQFKETNITPGGFSEYIRIPAEHVKHTLMKIPDSLSFATASFAEPLACCLRGLKRMGIYPGDRVVVVGGGAVGLLFIQLLKERLAGEIIVIDPEDSRLEKAANLGATQCINPLEEDRGRKLSAVLGEEGADRIILGVGQAKVLAEYVPFLGKGGTLLLFAPFLPEEVSFPVRGLCEDEKSFIGSYSSSPEDYPEALALLESGRIQSSPLVSHELALEHIPDVIKEIGTSSGKRKYLKVLAVTTE